VTPYARIAALPPLTYALANPVDEAVFLDAIFRPLSIEEKLVLRSPAGLSDGDEVRTDTALLVDLVRDSGLVKKKVSGGLPERGVDHRILDDGVSAHAEPNVGEEKADFQKIRVRARNNSLISIDRRPECLYLCHMSHTLTIRIRDDLARWLAETARAMGVPQGKLVRDQLEQAREQNVRSRGFMRLAGCIRGDKNLSTRKGFSGS